MARGIKRLDEDSICFEIAEHCAVAKTTEWDDGLRTMKFDMEFKDFCVAYQNWRMGLLIQDAFPNLSVTEREFLATGLTDGEWDSLLVQHYTDVCGRSTNER